MSALFSDAEAAVLSMPHVSRCWFGQFDLPVGMRYLATAAGNVVIDGQEYIGVTDWRDGGRLVSVGMIEEQRFGRAPAVVIILSGASKEFIQSVHATRHEIEGRAAKIGFAAFDPETQTLATGLKWLIAKGKMSAPSTRWQSIGRRYVSLTVESRWSSINYAPGGKWNAADRRRKYSGDKGFDFVDTKISENWQ